jgi:hypothetical protein
VEPDESQTTISDHPAGETGEDVSDWPEWYTEEQPEATGTSSQPPQQQKDKIQIPRSPRKKPATEIVLPRIPEGVQVGPELLGHVGKLKYSDHDVADEAKFPELAKRVFLQTTGTNPLENRLISHTVGNWAGENENFRSVGPTTFWQRPERNNMHQTAVSSHTWRGHMAGQAHPHNR